MHQPVLVAEFLDYFSGCQLRSFVDGTLGAGGHSAALLEVHPEVEILVGIDQDADARRLAGERLASWGERVRIIEGNFGDLRGHLDRLKLSGVDGMFFDLGVSSMQLDWGGEGF